MCSFRDDPAFLFEQRVTLADGLAIIRAWEAPGHVQASNRFGHTTIELELRFRGEVLWPRGSTTVGTPSHVSVDGDEAKALTLSLFELKPGDTDADFFADYTPEQLAFVQSHSDEIMMTRWARFGEDS